MPVPRAQRELPKVRTVPERAGYVALRAVTLRRVVYPHLAKVRRLQERRLERIRRVDSCNMWSSVGSDIVNILPYYQTQKVGLMKTNCARQPVTTEAIPRT